MLFHHQVKPYGKWAMLELDSRDQYSSGGAGVPVILEDSARYLSRFATVRAAGPLCNDLEPGDRVIVAEKHLGQTFDFDDAGDMLGEWQPRGKRRFWFMANAEEYILVKILDEDTGILGLKPGVDKLVMEMAVA